MRVYRTGAGVTVRTSRGRMAAARVIIATGYATPDFKPLAGRFRMKHTYVLATRPVSRRDRRTIGVSDVLLWDTARPYHYARWTDDGRLLLGGGDRPLVSPARRRLALRRSLRVDRRSGIGECCRSRSVVLCRL